MLKEVADVMTGKSELSREIDLLKNKLETANRNLAIERQQNYRYWHALNEIRKYTKKEYGNTWYERVNHVSVYAIAKCATNKGRNNRLLKDVPEDFKSMARDIMNVTYHVVEKKQTIKASLKSVREQRGESFRRFKWSDSMQPYRKKA